MRYSADGWIDDVLALSSVWGFDVADIKVPVYLWHGGRDTDIPASHARWLSTHIAGAFTQVPPGCGGIAALEVMPEVLSWLSGGRPSEADQAEREAWIALQQGAFDEAIRLFRDAVRLDPGRGERLQPDLAFLSPQADEPQERLTWRRGLWLALAANSPLRLEESQPSHATAVTSPQVSARPIKRKKKKKPPAARKPQQAGAELESAFVILLRRFFELAAEDLERLRRQTSGSQFGHDVQFDCVTAANHLVRCHVECKNYTSPVKRAEIADKIVQTLAHWSQKEIDYFLIVTPRACIGNDLDQHIQALNAQKKLPFKILVWGPDEGIDKLFAIEPEAYKMVYGEEPPPVNVDEVDKVVGHWSAKLKPFARPPALEPYLTQPRRHSLRGEDGQHFDALFEECVEVGALNQAGSPLGSLHDELREWAVDPERHRMLLLGEFGDGKSFACYQLTRMLAASYLENPAGSHFPLRLSLKDLSPGEHPQELLSRRLKEIGADVQDWAELLDTRKTLIILDGFDEMSNELDTATVKDNIKLLARCAQFFEKSKLLIASRTHFFEKARTQELFMEQLEHPDVIRLAKLPLADRIRYMQALARQQDLSVKFDKICRLYDPVGLAAKPLFLQMIMQTLERLPDDSFDEVELYKTSVRLTLERKWQMLIDRGMHSHRKDVFEGLEELLEAVAVKLLQNGGQPVDLRTFGEDHIEIASVLWKMSAEDAGAGQAQDARARLGMRSLLEPFPDAGESETWPVAFSHRSMGEYFVARALVRAIRDDETAARSLLTDTLLQPEVIDFAGLLVSRADDAATLTGTLGRLARSAVKGSGQRHLGGNAVTLAYRARQKPDNSKWTGLDLSHADLSRADLAGADFSDSLLRGAILDNADLAGTNLTRCDLTDARIEETAPVIHVSPGRQEGSILACYGDGTIREWDLEGSRPVPRKILDGLASPRTTAWGPHGYLIVIDGTELSLRVMAADKAGPPCAFQIRSGIDQARFTGGTVSFTWTNGHLSLAVSYNCSSAAIAAGFPLAAPGPAAFDTDQTTALIAAGKQAALVKAGQRKPVLLSVPAADLTALDIQSQDTDMVQLAIGDGNGNLTVLQTSANDDSPATGAKATLQLHQGPVVSASFISQGVIATGGTDRKLTICRWNDGQLRKLHELKLTLHCPGVQTDSLHGDAERQMLEKLRDNAEKQQAASRK